MHWFWRAAIAVVVPSVLLACLQEVVSTLPDLLGGGELGWTLAVFLLSLLASILAVGMFRLLLGRCLPDHETRCRKCGYILRGITEPRCPECGERI